MFDDYSNRTLTDIFVHPDNGLTETLRQLKELEAISFQNLSFVNFIQNYFQTDCIACLPGKVWNYVQSNFKYVKDSPQDEVILAPYILIQDKKGDCDDFALFIKTVIDIIGGWQTHYVLFGKRRGVYTHIAVFAYRICNGEMVDPLVIDGVNKFFNQHPVGYNFNKVIQ